MKANGRGRTKLALPAAATILVANDHHYGDDARPRKQWIYKQPDPRGDGSNCIINSSQGNCVISPKEPGSGGRATADHPAGHPPWTFYVYNTVADETDPVLCSVMWMRWTKLIQLPPASHAVDPK